MAFFLGFIAGCLFVLLVTLGIAALFSRRSIDRIFGPDKKPPARNTKRWPRLL